MTAIFRKCPNCGMENRFEPPADPPVGFVWHPNTVCLRCRQPIPNRLEIGLDRVDGERTAVDPNLHAKPARKPTRKRAVKT